jgi:hypothetical protein
MDGYARIGAVLFAAWLGCALGATPASAAATLDATLCVRLRNGTTGEFANLSLAETGDGGLEISIRLLDDLGPRADLNKLYFNLPSDVSGLEVESLDDPHRPFDLRRGRRARGGNDSRFDFAVRFGKGRGRNGNGTLQEARFVLRGDRELTLSDLLSEHSRTNRGILAHFALLVAGATGGGPTVGAFVQGVTPVPEPGTACLLGAGLLALGASRRGRRGSAPER